jgi:hypothetical protein
MKQITYICDACYNRGKTNINATQICRIRRVGRYDLCKDHTKEIKTVSQTVNDVLSFILNRKHIPIQQTNPLQETKKQGGENT